MEDIKLETAAVETEFKNMSDLEKDRLSAVTFGRVSSLEEAKQKIKNTGDWARVCHPELLGMMEEESLRRDILGIPEPVKQPHEMTEEEIEFSLKALSFLRS